MKKYTAEDFDDAVLAINTVYNDANFVKDLGSQGEWIRKATYNGSVIEETSKSLADNESWIPVKEEDISILRSILSGEPIDVLKKMWDNSESMGLSVYNVVPEDGDLLIINVGSGYAVAEAGSAATDDLRYEYNPASTRIYRKKAAEKRELSLADEISNLVGKDEAQKIARQLVENGWSK